MIDALILAQNFSLNLEFHMHMWNYKITMVTEIISGKMNVFRANLHVRSPPISDHLSKTPKCSQLKPYNWNLS